MKNEDAMQSEELKISPLRHASNLPFRILLVDDDSQMRELYAGILIRYGYNVDTAENGIVAWNTLNEVSYDLLITDNSMPRLTGLELIKKVRSEGMKLPVILASGTVPLEELYSNSSLRIDATLFKPFYTEELLATVKNVLYASNRDGEQSMPFLKVG